MCVCRYFVSSRRRHTRCGRDWSSDVCSSDLQKASEHGNGTGYRHGKKFGNEKSSKSRNPYSNAKPKPNKPYSSSFKEDNKAEQKDEKKSDGAAAKSNSSNSSDPWAKWR